MVSALRSTCPVRTPCRAAVGSAWWRLCHDSPNAGIASHHTLVDRSRDANGALPNTWQIELMLHVTWWTNATRTTPAQKSAVSAPCHDQVSSPPSTAGSSSDATTIAGNHREIAWRSLSAAMSGAYLSIAVCSSSNSQPTCA